jgi:hypothetical protein
MIPDGTVPHMIVVKEEDSVQKAGLTTFKTDDS